MTVAAPLMTDTAASDEIPPPSSMDWGSKARPLRTVMGLRWMRFSARETPPFSTRHAKSGSLFVCALKTRLPKPDLRAAPKEPLFDHLVGAGEQRRRHVEAERLGRLEINGELEFRWQHHRQIGGLGPPENPTHVDPPPAGGIRYAPALVPPAPQLPALPPH